jgi:hypothetical protein
MGTNILGSLLVGLGDRGWEKTAGDIRIKEKRSITAGIPAGDTSRGRGLDVGRGRNLFPEAVSGVHADPLAIQRTIERGEGGIVDENSNHDPV